MPKEMLGFLSECQLKKVLRDTYIDASSVVWTLIDNGKLANQIAKLAAVVIKIKFFAHARLA